MSLNKSQEEAYDKILAFLFNDEPYFLLSGGPGYGKTYLANELKTSLLNQYMQTCNAIGMPPKYDSMDLTATTNSAADSLSSIDDSACTIYNFLGLYVYSNRLHQRKSHFNGCITRAIIIIDEYTMIDDDLLRYIESTTKGCKIIFVGDKDQLLAVSGIADKLAKMVPDHRLDIPQRTTSAEILHCVSEMKKLVQGHSIDDIPVTGLDLEAITEDEFEQRMTDPTVSLDDSRIITHMNDTAILFNDIIREARGLPPHFTAGEFVTNNKFTKIQANCTVGTDALLRVYQHLATESVFYCGEWVDIHRYEVRRGSTAMHIWAMPNKMREHILKTDEYAHIQSAASNSLDLRSTLTSTIYKAQGRTFETIYINLSGFPTHTTRDMLARSLYVAASRASKKVVFVGELLPELVGKL